MIDNFTLMLYLQQERLRGSIPTMNLATRPFAEIALAGIEAHFAGTKLVPRPPEKLIEKVLAQLDM